MKSPISQAIKALCLLAAFQCAGVESDEIKQSVRQHMQNRRYALAEALIAQLLAQNDKDVQSLSDLAWIHWMQNDKEECRRILDLAIKINPESAPISFIYSLLYFDQGNIEAAVRFIDIARRADPAYPAYKRQKALLLLRQFKPDEARAEISDIDSAGSGITRVINALVVESKGDRKGAKALLFEETKKDEAGIMVKYNLARMIGWGRNVDASEARQAVALLEEVAVSMGELRTEFIPECVFHFVAASVYASIGDYDLAVIYQQAALATYEKRCGIEIGEFKAGLENFKNEKRVVRE